MGAEGAEMDVMGVGNRPPACAEMDMLAVVASMRGALVRVLAISVSACS